MLGADGSQCLTHRLDQSLLGADADLAEDVVDRREGFFYRFVCVCREGSIVKQLYLHG
jgi:hypothetical protein